MGVKGVFAPQIGGGVLCCMLSIYQPAFINSRHLSESSITPQGQKSIESVQKGAKSNIYLLVFVLPRDFRRQREAKT